MNGKVLVLPLLLAVTVVLTACGGQGVPPGSGGTTAVGGGALSVELTQGPPATMVAGQQLGLFATVFNDKNNAGATWSCTPANACGSFSPATTGYLLDTLYTAPVASANGPITQNLAYTVTITATSVADSSQSASATVTVGQKYAFVMAGYASFGMVGSVTLDGLGNVTGGETDYSANPNQVGSFPITGTYTLDATTGYGTMTWTITGCCSQTNAITAASNSHLTIAEVDQFSGLTFGGTGSMDLQAVGPGPSFSGAQVSGGYSFTLSGYDGAQGFNGSWGGIFTADGSATAGTPGNITGGIFDTSLGGGASGYSSTAFTGTYTAPDANGRGIMDLSNGASYVYYIVTPEVLRLTTTDDAVNKSDVGSAANTGSAYGQGSLATGATDGSLNGSFIFSAAGFSNDNNGGEQGAAAGQFTTDGNGNIETGVMDVNTLGTVSTLSLAGSTYNFPASGSPRGTVTGPSGQAYYIYLTDPNLNLLDPNNTTGTGGALLLEADTADTIGVVIPQTDANATIAGGYAFIFSDQANPPNADGGFDGQFTAPSSGAGTFSGQGAYQGTSANSLIPIVGPLGGTFAADGANPGRYTGTITTTPDLWSASIGDSTPGTENVSYYFANGSQGFVVETDSLAPAVGTVEVQTGLAAGASAKRGALQQQHSHPKNLLQRLGEQHGQLDNHAGSGHE